MWTEAKFPFHPASPEGRAAHQAYLPSDSGARWKRIPRGVAFAWSGGGQAVCLSVLFGEGMWEVEKYVIRAYGREGFLDRFMGGWKPEDAASREWCRAVRDYFEGKEWDEKAADMVASVSR